MELFTELSESAEIESQFRAFGLAGQCIVLFRSQKTIESMAKLREMQPLRDRLTDEQLQAALAGIIRESEKMLSQKDKQKWEQWLKSTTEEPN